MGLLCAVTTYAQKIHMCADNAPSACIMRGCVFCVDYAHSAHVRMCGAAQRAHMRSVRICACALVRRMRRGRAHRTKAPKCIIFLRILEREGDSGPKHGCPDTRAGKRCAMKIAKHTPATRCRRPQHELSRTRASKGPPTRNAVTLNVLEHVHTSKFPIPAVRVAVRNPLKT